MCSPVQSAGPNNPRLNRPWPGREAQAAWKLRNQGIGRRAGGSGVEKNFMRDFAIRQNREPGDGHRRRNRRDRSRLQERQWSQMAKLAAMTRSVRMLDSQRRRLRADHGAQEERDQKDPRPASMDHLAPILPVTQPSEPAGSFSNAPPLVHSARPTTCFYEPRASASGWSCHPRHRFLTPRPRKSKGL